MADRMNRTRNSGNRITRRQFIRRAGVAGGVAAAAVLGLGGASAAHLPHAVLPSALEDNPDQANIIGKIDSDGNPIDRSAVSGDREIWVYPSGKAEVFQSINIADFSGASSPTTTDAWNVQWAVGLDGMSHRHDCYWSVSIRESSDPEYQPVKNNDYFDWFDGENHNWFEFQADDSFVPKLNEPNAAVIDVRGRNTPADVISAIWDVTYNSNYLTNDQRLWFWSPFRKGAESNSIHFEAYTYNADGTSSVHPNIIPASPEGWVNVPPDYGRPLDQTKKYWGYDFIQYPATGVAAGGTVVLKAAKKDGTPYFFQFGNETGTGHVELAHDVVIRGERLPPDAQVVLPNNNVVRQFSVPYGDLTQTKTVQPRTIIYGGGPNAKLEPFGPFTCRNNIDFTLEGLWFDSSIMASVLVHASKNRVVFNDNVGTNCVPFDLWGDGFTIAYGMFFAVSTSPMFVRYEKFVYGDILVTNNVASWQIPEPIIGNVAFGAQDLYYLDTLTVTDNIVQADYGFLLLVPSVTSATITASRNTLMPSDMNSGTWTDVGMLSTDHFMDGRRTKNLNARDNWLYNVKNCGFQIQFSDGPISITNNHILGYYGNGEPVLSEAGGFGAINVFGSNGCTIQGNEIETAENVIANYGIAADGSTGSIGYPSMCFNNSITDNKVSGRYGFPLFTGFAASCSFERNDFSNAEAVETVFLGEPLGGVQAFVGPLSSGCTFKGNKYGPGQYGGMLAFSESSTYTNDNFMGNYPGWMNGSGCVLFDGSARNNTVTALKNGVALQGMAVCDQVLDIPDFEDSTYKCINTDAPMPYVFDLSLFGLPQGLYAVMPPEWLPPEAVASIYQEASYNFGDAGFAGDNPTTAYSYQRANNDNAFIPVAVLDEASGAPEGLWGFVLYVRGANLVMTQPPDTTVTFPAFEGIPDALPPIPAYAVSLPDPNGTPLKVLKNNKVPGYEKCLRSSSALIDELQKKAVAFGKMKKRTFRWPKKTK